MEASVIRVAPSLGLDGRTARIVAFDQNWTDAFELIAARLGENLTLAGVPHRVAHVGSTAIRGMSAKPILDVALGVTSLADMTRIHGVLIEQGFDYIKAGNRPGMLLFGLGDPRVALVHVVEQGSRAWDRLVLVRDLLRRHPTLAAEYAQMKSDLVESTNGGRRQYSNGKATYMRTLVHRAHFERRRLAVGSAIRRASSNLDRFEQGPMEGYLDGWTVQRTVPSASRTTPLVVSEDEDEAEDGAEDLD
jgi:GrpB-like predicted nucleotidyltransferase (UPF0157 family)